MAKHFELINTASGHMVVCLAIILIGAVFCALHVPKGEDLIVGGSTGLFYAMRLQKEATKPTA